MKKAIFFASICLVLLAWTASQRPNDPLFPRQWHLFNQGQSGGDDGADIRALDAWRITTGGLTTQGDSIVICLIDEGIGLKHPDLQANLWRNHQEIPNNGIDDDQNGYIDDVQGWNVFEQNDQFPSSRHGTPLAGIMAAVGNNGIGITGINWDCKLMPVLGGLYTEETVVNSYRYPLDMRRLYQHSQGEKGAYVVVINASWGMRNTYSTQFPAWCGIYDSLGEAGILSVASVVNDRLNIDKVSDMPAACNSPFLITVTSSDHYDGQVMRTGYGRYRVDLAAPADQVYSLRGNSGYMLVGGTSSAAPQVSGAVALLYSAPLPGLMALQAQNPALAALQVKDWIMRGVDSLQQFAGRTRSGGRLNIGKAMRLAMEEDSCLSCPPPLGMRLSRTTTDHWQLRWTQQNADSVQLFIKKGELWQLEDRDQLDLASHKAFEGYVQAFCGKGKSRKNHFRMHTGVDL